VALVDGSGAVQTQYTYEPFGATATSGAGSTNPAQFTGRENDGTGLYYYRARYYDPRYERFLSEDPIGFGAGDVNLHAYAFNAPTKFRDPSGKFVVPLLLCAAGAGGSAAADWMSGRKFNPVMAAAWCVAGLTLGVSAPAIVEALAYRAAAAAAPVVAARAASGLTYQEVSGLKEFFGRSLDGANQLLERLNTGESVQLPESVTPETLQKYRDIAEKAIQQGKDNLGVQQARRAAIDLFLRRSGGK
jgi:RHS repeat-associated protein